MKTKLFATLVLLTGINVLQAMESSKAASARIEQSTELQVQLLLQEFADKYSKLLDEYPSGASDFVGPRGDWSKKVDNISKTLLEKIKAIDPKAAENITKLNAAWRAKATPKERRNELVKALKSYKKRWQYSQNEPFVNEASKKYFRNNEIRRFANLTGLKIDTDLSAMTDDQLKQLADSFIA